MFGAPKFKDVNYDNLNLRHVPSIVAKYRAGQYLILVGLMDAGYRVHQAHVAAIKLYEGLKHSGDAAYLAQLLRLGLLPEGYIYRREQRAARDLARKRIQLVRCCTGQLVSIENLVARHTGARPGCAQVKLMAADQVNALKLRH